MRQKKKMYAFTAVLLACALLLPVFVYADSEVVLDVTTHKVYQPIDVTDVIGDFAEDPESASHIHSGRNYMAVGRVISTDGTVLKLGPASGSSRTAVSCDIGNAAGSGNISAGDLVHVYGTVQITYRLVSSLKMTADKVEKAENDRVNSDIYITAGGETMDPDDLTERSIGGGDFLFSIPESWARAEYELPNVSGFQYKLNELTGAGDAESFFVFYVDAELLENRGDITKTTKVQKAIVHDILGSTKSIRRRLIPFLARDIDMVTLRTDYAEFVNYSGHYRDPNGIDHRIEFMFLPSENMDYVRCLMYVYTGEASFSEEILLFMRCLDI